MIEENNNPYSSLYEHMRTHKDINLGPSCTGLDHLIKPVTVA